MSGWWSSAISRLSRARLPGAGRQAGGAGESLKLLGSLREGKIVTSPCIASAQCNRVPVRDGHLERVSLQFQRKPEVDEVVAALKGFRGAPEAADLPNSPELPILLRQEPDRPQPMPDRDAGRGLAIVVGRVRACPVLDAELVVLGHNAVRGAAGGSIHNAELLVAQGWA